MSASQVVQGRLPDSMPSVAKRSSNSNDNRVGAQLSTVTEADIDIDMTEEAAGSCIETDAATAATANEGELAYAEPRLPLPENVQRAEVFQVHQLAPVDIQM